MIGVKYIKKHCLQCNKPIDEILIIMGDESSFCEECEMNEYEGGGHWTLTNDYGMNKCLEYNPT